MFTVNWERNIVRGGWRWWTYYLSLSWTSSVPHISQSPLWSFWGWFMVSLVTGLYKPCPLLELESNHKLSALCWLPLTAGWFTLMGHVRCSPHMQTLTPTEFFITVNSVHFHNSVWFYLMQCRYIISIIHSVLCQYLMVIVTLTFMTS